MIQFAKKGRGILEKTGKVDSELGAALLKKSHEEKRPITEVVVNSGLVSEAELLSLIAKAANIPPIDLTKVRVDPEVLEAVPLSSATEFMVFPVDRIGSVLTVAVANPFDVLKLDDVRIITGCQIRPVLTTQETLERVLPAAYRSDADSVDDILDHFDEDIDVASAVEEEETLDLSAIKDEEGPVVKMVNKIIHDACTSGASDIHIEPYERKVTVRFRRDGRLVEVLTLPKKMQNNLVSRCKIMAKLDIAEKFSPQDGKIQMRIGKRAIDFRVSILPVVWGEKVVFRVLDSSNLALDITSLNFEERSMQDYLWAIERPYGMILVTGPTGSGKSTTLYSAVKHIADPEINLVTVEDPVEYTLEGINQVPVNPKRGMTFAGALRSILRQDPDVVLLGEIRDTETLEIAVKAALTGHLVLSTLHTNDAPSTITRMVDMGMDGFMVASSTNLICAQRLARTLCDHCKQPADLGVAAYLDAGFTAEEIEASEFQPYKAVGCPRCTNGYKGRFALMETMRMTEPVKRLVVDGAHVGDIKKQALEDGMLTLRRCGLLNVARGKTGLEEVERVTMAD